ncbi:MAG TPA: patatin, partial [Rikenellaceae bacterium]|nr:patatin [Rikenellaceae bacterium]
MQIKKILAAILLLLVTSWADAQSVGLVLSGGGAKGISHIGVIKALEDNDIPIDYVAGTSMGAIVAALYSIGVTPNEMLAMFRSPEFNSWYKGEFEKGYGTYIYRREPTAEMVGVSLSQQKTNRLAIKLPTSLVAPYPMDLAVKQLFASSAATCGYD